MGIGFLRLKHALNPNVLYFCRMMSTSTQEVLFETQNNRGILTLNRPKYLNTLTLGMLQAMLPVLTKWEKECGLVIIKGAHEKSFCAGGDIRSIVLAAKKNDPLAADFFRTEFTTNSLVGTYHIPYIALMDGITMGGGVGMSVHGSFRVATERTLYAMPETIIGYFPDVGGTYFLPRLGGKLGLYLGLTGIRLKGRDVLKAGIANHICHSSRIPQLEKDLISMKNPTMNSVKELLSKYTKETDFDKDKPFSLEPHLDAIKRCFSPSTMEGIYAALEKEGTPWAKDTLTTLQKMSPTSMKVTLKQLELGETMNLQECLSLEYRIALQFIKTQDMHEGVRALLIDKDQKPQWNPKSLEGVTPEAVAKFFAPLPNPEDELTL